MHRLPPSWLMIAVAAFGLPRIVLAEPAACEVTITSAPPDVAGAVAASIHAERTCSSLAVSVVETDGGYLLRARRPDGLVFEMIAVDARRVGELVAGWATEGVPPTTVAADEIAVDFYWLQQPSPDIDVQLQWSRKPAIELERRWTPPSSPIDVGLIPQ